MTQPLVADSTLVIPTNRIESFEEFAISWSPIADWEKTIVVVDGPRIDQFQKVAEILPNPTVVGWHQIDFDLSRHGWIISRRDSAIRSYGFFLAWLGDSELICTLDDDCLPHQDFQISGHVRGHLERMKCPVWQSTIPGLRLRGMPFAANPQATLSADLNIGLWENVFDLSSVDQIAGAFPQGVHTLPSIQRTAIHNETVPRYVQVPMCGMNLAFTRKIAPLMYFGLQGQDRPVGRFDDIWCGVIAKRICDHLGLSWSFGHPIVWHKRASNAFKNLVREAPGIAEHIDLSTFIMATELDGLTTVTSCFRRIASELRTYAPVHLPKPYFVELSEAMETWIKLFDDDPEE